MNKKIVATGTALAILTFTGCGSSSSDDDKSKMESSSTFAMDASGMGKVRVNLETGTVSSDDSWHIAYQKYIGFSSNGGTSGNGNVKVCIAKKYDKLYDSSNKPVEAEFQGLTIENTKADFEKVTLADCNSSTFQSDSIKTQIETSHWLSADYSAGAPIYSARTDNKNSWIIRSASKTNDAYTYAKVKVKDVSVVFGATTTRKMTLSSEVFDGTQFKAAVDSPELDFSSNKVYWDMETNSIVTKDDNWELAISVVGRDYPLQVNGGASGSGEAGVGLLMEGQNIDTVTNPADTTQIYKYFGDLSDGGLTKPGNYGAFQYGVGGSHKMWPTFAVYIVKDGEKYYKTQVLSNYGENGALASGNLVLRYKALK